MKYAHVVRGFFAHPLSILPQKLLEIESFLTLKSQGGLVEQEAIDRLVRDRKARWEAFLRAAWDEDWDGSPLPVAATRHPGALVRGKTGIVPVFGVLSQRVGLMEAMSGGISTEEIGATLDGLAADKEVSRIVMVFDSPGGSVFGTPELASKVYSLREKKKTVAVADSVMASAALWIGAQAGEVVITPGGQMGSVGVLAAHLDATKAEEMAGFKTTYVSSTPEKVELAPEMPLSAEARAHLQQSVDSYYGMFVKDLARGRNTTEARVRSDFGGGRMLLAREAVDAGLADRVATLQQTLARLGAGESRERAFDPSPEIVARRRALALRERC